MAVDAKYCAPYMVLRQDCSEEHITALADELSLERLADVTDADGVDRSIVWQLVEEVLLEYLVESRFKCAVAIVRGRPEKSVRTLADSFEQALNPFTRKELVAAVDAAGDPDERAAALVRMGMGAPRDFYHRGIFKRINAAMLDRTASRSVRLAAVWAAEYTRWPKFVKSLERVADEESRDDEPNVVRLHAQLVLIVWGYR